MAKRVWVLGTIAVLLGLVIVRWPHGATAGGGGGPTGSLAIADLDGDAKAETIRLVNVGPDRQVLKLDATRNGTSHDVLTVSTNQPLQAEVVTPGARWRFVDDTGETKLDVRAFDPGAGEGTNMVAVAGNQARRYVWLDHGFLKLDAAAVVPGFSVGLVMLGDPKRAIEAINGAPGKDGRWAEPLAQPVPLDLAFDDANRVASATFDSPRLKSASGLKTGAALSSVEASLPGKREGHTWVSATTGVEAALDARSRIASVTVSRPWAEGQAKP